MKKIGIVLMVLLWLVGSAWAANDVLSTPSRIDTFGADVVVGTSKTYVTNITVTAYTSTKTVTFIDASAAVVLVLECPAGSTISWPPHDAAVSGHRGVYFKNGLTFDDSASDLAAGDFIFIWKY